MMGRVRSRRGRGIGFDQMMAAGCWFFNNAVWEGGSHNITASHGTNDGIIAWTARFANDAEAGPEFQTQCVPAIHQVLLTSGDAHLSEQCGRQRLGVERVFMRQHRPNAGRTAALTGTIHHQVVSGAQQIRH
jgi:hypothetical protein